MLENKRIFSVILSVSLLCGVSNVTQVFAQDANIGTTRLSGNDRYKTSLAISKSGWAQANTVILATGADYPDALSASPLAKSYDAPILLTEKNALSSDTIAEIQRLKAANAILVGGTGVISTNVENQLKNMGVNITRIGGINRYETSKLVAEKLGTSNGIIVATGLDFPDALSIAPIAGIKAMPILLSPKDGLDPSIASFIKGKSIPVSYIVGGTGVLGDTVSSSVPNSKRLGGKNRYETNQIINNQFVGNLSTGTVFLATGNDFPDALSGSALSAKNNAPIILSDKNSITSDALNFIKSQSVRNVTILGGTGAISGNVLDVLTNVINGNIVIPSSVSLNKTTSTLIVGDTDTLIATVSPSNATNKNVQWSTSNSNVATVDAAGKVTAIGAGTATITATTIDGNKTANCNITVITAVVTSPVFQSLTIDKQNATVGDTINFTVNASDNISGIKSIYITYRTPITNKAEFIYLSLKNGVYVGSKTITNSDEAGTWKIEEIVLFDNANNITQVWNTAGGFSGTDTSTDKYQDLSYGNFNINGTSADVTSPVFQSLTIDKQNATVGDTINFTVNATDDISGIKSIYITYRTPITNKVESIFLSLKNGVYVGSKIITNSDEAGTWKIEEIVLFDNANNIMQVWNTASGLSGTDTSTNKYQDLSYGNFNINGTSADVTSVSLSKTTDTLTLSRKLIVSVYK
ncbi:cell wall-binding repeat-containing protein [Candidatus Clostridium radicumherbarum]|uniref:Cell wall-binding repeat-containing protein n=1 Tax=Candidatus Clostridium radicumherbarum TaxID=3381662 RepID=A0ABW8TTI0_9CLOT